MKKLYGLLALVTGLCFPALANHIVGGNMEMVAKNAAPGSYDLYLNLFFDEIGGKNTRKDPYITVSIFRKRDNTRMQNIQLNLQSTTPVQYANPACATARSLQTSTLRYWAPIDLPVATYNDPQGYYIAWERCCRNSGADNIVSPGAAGMTFYLEFPALQQNGQPFLDSSPVFGSVNGEYICANKPFSFSFAATDQDGDQLRYSLVTPWAGYATQAQPSPNLPTGSSSYPLVQWASGFDVGHQINGNPPLQVGGTTGLLTVTASQLGLHVFTVQVDEYRNGVKIGTVRRDFQLLVVDCPVNSLKDPTVYKDDTPEADRNKGIVTANFCENGYLDLITQNQPDASYQWQKDGINIPGATSYRYRAEAPGKYQVIVSSSKVCSESKKSVVVTLVMVPGVKAELTANVPLPACADQKVVLSTLSGNYTYLWKLDGDTLKGRTAASIPAVKSGQYSVRVQDKSTSCYYVPTKDVVINPIPRAVFTSVPSKRSFCGEDSVALVAFDSVGYTFQWRLNGQPITGATGSRYTIRQSGIYSFQASIGNCRALSDTFRVALYPSPTAAFDSIQAVCSSHLAKITLVGTPAGGVFAGKGVTGSEFNPALSGPGKFPITYTVKNQYGCKAVATRMAVVSASPKLSAGPDKGIVRGDSVRLEAGGDAGLLLVWTPPAGLSSSQVLQPSASPAQTTTYTLTGTTTDGCRTADDVIVTVWERITIPNGITPNGDGINDRWELPGIEHYPNAEVRVFNRWGSELFYSKGYSRPFDGNRSGARLPAATYYYVIQPNNGRPTISGSLTIIL